MANMDLRVETLGALRAFTGDRELDLGAPKQRALFAVVALNADDVVSRDSLIEAVWGESPPRSAVGSVHTYVSGLRRALAGSDAALDSAGPGYLLRLSAGRLDLAVVERLAARARSLAGRGASLDAVGVLDEALARWRGGPALAGLPGPFAAGYRVRAAELRVRLLIERAELLLGLARPAEAAEPYHERLRGLLMTALHRAGRTADALGQYGDLRRVLADDLGIDPSADSRSLHAAILAESTLSAGRSRADERAPPRRKGAAGPYMAVMGHSWSRGYGQA